jgi:predicted membrane protein
MLIVMTTANYPDVMLPSYKNFRPWFFFYCSFLVLGLFLFMNMLLAIFYNAYQEKSTQLIDEFDKSRTKYLNSKFKSLEKTDFKAKFWELAGTMEDDNFGENYLDEELCK